MSQSMQILLSSTPADNRWGDDALLSYDQQAITVHLTSDDSVLSAEKYQLRRIQLAARKLDSQGIPAVQLAGEHWSVARQWAFAQGFSSPKREENGVTWAASSSEAELDELNALRKSAQWVRDVTNATPEDLSPMQLASRAADFITGLAPEHTTYVLKIGEELEEMGYVGIHGVGRGSERPPVFLELDYNPTGNPDAPVAVALVGKGITFDSGGYSLKPSAGMLGMKGDMGGAGIVTGGLGLAIQRGLNQRIKLLLCCAENLVSGKAYKLGDILEFRNGVSVEITNTDAEGRLVMADGLIRAGELEAELVIDGATLTGAAKVAVGRDYNAAMSLDGDLLHRMLSYAADEHEMLWPLPLEKFHANAAPSAYADTANAGGRFGGASSAAGFLSRFVKNPEKNWIHLDLSGAFLADGETLWAKGATAMGIKTIARTLIEETV